MPVADRTFSFRAPDAFASRLRAAERAYTELSDDAALAAHIGRELDIGLQRRLRDAPERGGQGRILRAVAEAFVDATESAARGQVLAGDLRAFDAADREGATERRALQRRSAALVDE